MGKCVSRLLLLVLGPACFAIHTLVADVISKKADGLEDLQLSSWPVNGTVALGPKDLGFFLQTNDSSARLHRSLCSVRRSLPEAPFYLLSDGGPNLTDFAEAHGIHAEQAPHRTHLAKYLKPHNFKCRGHLERLADAAVWLSAQGARYLMIWEEDTHMLRKPGLLPDVDLVTDGNLHLFGAAWKPVNAQKLRDASGSSLNKQDVRRQAQLDQYAARGGSSAGPMSVFKIESFLKAVSAAQADDMLDNLYPLRDQCWEDFAIARGLTISRWTEVMQMTSPFDPSEKGDKPLLWRCMECLDQCRRTCGCVQGRWGMNFLKHLWLSVATSFLDPRHFHHSQQRLVLKQSCGTCSAGTACWTDCRARCEGRCPAGVHPHKRSQFDCGEEVPSEDHKKGVYSCNAPKN